MTFSEKNIKTIVNFLKWFYLLIAIAEIFLLIGNYFLNARFSIELVMGILLAISFFIGLRARKPWVIPLLLIVSSIALFSQIFTSVVTETFLIAKVVGIGISLFLIYFCTKKEVRAYFGTKGLFLFSR
ncbi:hypothetical protein A2870_04790 [Candidatus Curtissbacteria bacterium RIFCSPHIGHO2_01_FULL_41_11]|uniref:Uncharacterized protein n=1 Tax=Candidatus Curtissbacteria bacterium RIFCSPHIGHO2_01_FULL_41_11 TaxID=1797711 RepID=A0A1F5G4E5_9BACT|nr:MAG: hypothetical protein A2870_04790 [Candidatus Curtissbacteria bacterium RIFCSPHIGHO2_01_FULL_41_11]